MYETRMVRVGDLTLGGHNPVWVQSMTNTDTRDAQATLGQIRALAKAGCDIVRVSVYDEDCARAVRTLVDGSPVPLVADIHFNHRLAIAAAENGIHKLRINPGNIGGEAHVRELAEAAKAHHIPIRIGVNTGSIEKDILAKYGQPCAEGLVESALNHARMLEKVGLADRADSYPSQLSGGQQQRVAIARGLATQPEIILFDEPTSALDPELTGEVLAVMRGLAQEGMTMLVVTHEMNFARNVSSKVVFMEGGVVVEESRDPKAFFQNPSQERSKAFLRTILGETEQEEIQ